MNCRRVETLLSDHLEGFLPKRVSEQITAHLDGCPACRRQRNEMTALSAGLRQLPSPPPPPDLRRRALDHWAAEEVMSGRRPSVRSGAAGQLAFTGRAPC